MVSGVNAPGIGGGQASPKRCAETHARGRLNAYRWPRMVGRDCARGGSHSGSRQLADKDEAEVQALPGPPLALTSATLAKHRRGLVVVRITGRMCKELRLRGSRTWTSVRRVAA
jgi:hypothetical protein